MLPITPDTHMRSTTSAAEIYPGVLRLNVSGGGLAAASHEFALIQFLCSPDAFIYRARMDAVQR